MYTTYCEEGGGMKKIVAVIVCCLASTALFTSYAQDKERGKEEIVGLATQAVKGQGFSLNEVDIIYDEGGKLWAQRLGAVRAENTSPNYGILKEGFLKNYRIVFFDFKEPLRDVWVFIDKDTGEVFSVYQEP